MDEEIKEILDKKVIIDQHWNYIITGNEKYYLLPKRLLDYITNLQQENERLKDTLNKIMASDGETTTPILDLIKEKEDYKSRIEKALLIIEKQKKKMYKSRNKIAMFILVKLDNILNGKGSDE